MSGAGFGEENEIDDFYDHEDLVFGRMSFNH